ncbi:MAG TPA: hypothetical protein VM261_02190 [Kofleriaceae bacterium]|nr:hypothetical protein [Kofleriaceae bacterium]
MFRPITLGRRALSCLTLAAFITALGSPAAAQAKKKKVKKKTPVSVCAHFDQVDKEDDGVDLVVANRCDVKLACSVSWTLTCTPHEGSSSRSQHGAAFDLDTGADQSTLASPATCGNDGWTLDDVTWSCQPEPKKVVAKNDRK